MRRNELTAQAVLEQMLAMAVDSARDAAKDYRAKGGDFNAGLVQAYYEMLSWAKSQTELMEYDFAKRELASFDPDKELLIVPEKKAA